MLAKFQIKGLGSKNQAAQPTQALDRLDEIAALHPKFKKYG
jgi:hypothetical protein